MKRTTTTIRLLMTDGKWTSPMTIDHFITHKKDDPNIKMVFITESISRWVAIKRMREFKKKKLRN